jgi:hypothetical protein
MEMETEADGGIHSWVWFRGTGVIILHKQLVQEEEIM